MNFWQLVKCWFAPSSCLPQPASKPIVPTPTQISPQYAQTRGVKNRNYLCVKGRGWIGQTGTDERGHAIFSAPEYGLRAAIITLRSYWFKHGLRTVAGILSRWAPATDTIGSILGAPSNSPREYSLFVCRRMNSGVGPNTPLDLFNTDNTIRDAAQLMSLVSAMASYEIGGSFVVPKPELLRAINLV